MPKLRQNLVNREAQTSHNLDYAHPFYASAGSLSLASPCCLQRQKGAMHRGANDKEVSLPLKRTLDIDPKTWPHR